MDNYTSSLDLLIISSNPDHGKNPLGPQNASKFIQKYILSPLVIVTLTIIPVKEDI